MKFKFKIQKFQTDAVDSIVSVFEGQPFVDKVHYTRDIGAVKEPLKQISIVEDEEESTGNVVGFENARIHLSDAELLENIHKVQTENNLKLSATLVNDLGRCGLDIEMETGTGKTYVYIKSIFELNKRYGWSKFIIVIPSIAIREGVKKSFEMTQDHFMEYYGKKARFFIYNSAHLNDLDAFSSNSSINVMIINSQAFNAFSEDGTEGKAKGKDARKIYVAQDSFGSRKPIDVIAANNPIIILDEPQKLGGDKTQKCLKYFKPLFSMNFSATHVKQHNLVYVLDALEAYNQKLVKRIEVKGFEVKNLRGTSKYLYFQNVILSQKQGPRARVEIEKRYTKSNRVNREVCLLKVGDNLFYKSNEMEQYSDNYVVSEINSEDNSITFLNGEKIYANNVVGDITEKDLRRIQIRETIQSHFEKEEHNFYKGIKTLSLFFIDEVAKYRLYDENGQEQYGEYAKMFEEEYNSLVNEKITLLESPYVDYLKKIETQKTHNGYFSIDKKTNRMTDGSIEKRGEQAGLSNDISAYDLILKNKERLLSFEEPTRFIFSHSALREGWDNPNVFQICTLKKSDSSITKRQEVGRGMRLCVNVSGERMDSTVPGISVHDLNTLTVIASDSYSNFVSALQKEIQDVIHDRPKTADKEFFIGKYIADEKGERVAINKKQAASLYRYLVKNDYIDDNDKISDAYRNDFENDKLAVLPDEFAPYTESVQKLIRSVYDENIVASMFENANAPKVVGNTLNENFKKAEFQELWQKINHRYAYTVQFDSQEIIDKSISAIDSQMFVNELKYVRRTGIQTSEMEENQVARGESISVTSSKTVRLKRGGYSDVQYDIIGAIKKGTNLMRKSVAAVLKGIKPTTFAYFALNPEEFISKCVKFINEQKATMFVDHIEYNQAEGQFDSTIFTQEKSKADLTKAFKSNKNVQDYVFTDGSADKSVEKIFAAELDASDDVVVYAKLPKGFYIPTPVGNYSPDWAIAFEKGTVRHVFFIAETKGSMSSMELRGVELAKTRCAKKLFNDASTSAVRYGVVDSYDELFGLINSIE